MTNQAFRNMCLLKEVETSINLLKKGMCDLQKISGSNDFYHPPILLLSSGFERLMKCLLCLANMDDNGNLSTIPFIKSHDLEYLLSEVLKICEEKGYSNKFPAARHDIDLLSSNSNLREIISILSNFAQGGRYYNLDIVLKGNSEYDDPINGWNKIEEAILKAKPNLKLFASDKDLDHFYREINHELIIYLEKFARVLSRLFTLSDFGNFAMRVSPLVYDFLMLRNDELGTKEY